MRILKDFKCCVLEVRILRELEVGFLEMQILKSLEEKTKLGKTSGAEAPHLQRREKELRSEKTPGEAWCDWMECDENPSRLRVNMQ
jgi:hypothetical protein